MKNFLLLFVCPLFSLSTLYSQCEAPELESWTYPNDSTLVIEFTTTADVLSYELEISVLMMDVFNLDELPDPFIVVGEAQEGLNTVTITSAETDQPFDHQYSSVIMRGLCETESNSADLFYVSDMSLLNDGICPDVEILNTFLPDGEGFSFESTFEVPETEVPLQIDDFSIFVDLTHSYLGDLDIQLTSPAGTTIYLMEFPNAFGGRFNMSVVFENGADSLELTTLEDGFETLRGVHSPVESFDAFIGEILSGTWTITITDNLAVDWGVLCGTCLTVETSDCEASAQGTVFYDYNNNGIQEEEEPPFPYHIFSTSQENSFMTNNVGEFSNCFGAGELDVNFNYMPLYHTLYPEGGYSLTLEPGDYLEDLDFRLVPTPGITDLIVDLYSTLPDVPGFERTYHITVSNIGTECVDGAVLDFSSPELVEISTVNGELTGSDSDNSFSINLEDICPGQSIEIPVVIFISEETEVGISHDYQVGLTMAALDETPENNTLDYSTTVVASYDPNDKTVNYETVYEDFMEDEKRLSYIVRFQNDGSFYAENVIITDSIEEGLILESFQLLESSHDVVPEINGNELSFNFIGIQLPQSDLGLEESQGYVRFSFLPTEDFSLGETIENTAAIYFDFNEPIITNTAVTTFEEEEIIIIDNISELTENGIQVFPNPAREFIQIQTENGNMFSSLEIADITGKNVFRESFDLSQRQKIDLSNLQTGIYLLKIFTLEGEIIISKFSKK